MSTRRLIVYGASWSENCINKDQPLPDVIDITSLIILTYGYSSAPNRYNQWDRSGVEVANQLDLSEYINNGYTKITIDKIGSLGYVGAFLSQNIDIPSDKSNIFFAGTQSSWNFGSVEYSLIRTNTWLTFNTQIEHNNPSMSEIGIVKLHRS